MLQNPELPHPAPKPKYPVPVTKDNILRIFSGAADFTLRELMIGRNAQRIWVCSIDGLVSSSEISDFVMKPLMRAEEPVTLESAKTLIYNAVESPVPDMDAAAEKLVNGFCLVLFGEGQAAAFEVKTGEKRSVSAPEVENTIKGAKDAFTETVRTNTSLVRRHLRTPELRLEEQVIGRRSLTNVTVCWIAGITDPKMVQAVSKRLRGIDVDGLLTPAAVEEYLTGSRKTAFPMQIYTERADRFAWGLMAGRVGILVDGLPLGYLLPCCLRDFMQSPEDRGGNYIVASVIKFLRYLSLIAALLLPGMFVAVSLYHQEMIPIRWLRAIAESRNSVPFSVGVEVVILLIAFELLQEAGLHLPKNLGQAVSIIGGLVVGSAAVEASLISPAALIIVAAAGVCGFTLPQRDFSDAIRVWRMALVIGGLIGGMAGVTIGVLALIVHLAQLSSLGVNYLWPMAIGETPDLQRQGKRQKYRPAELSPENMRNQR